MSELIKYVKELKKKSNEILKIANIATKEQFFSKEAQDNLSKIGANLLFMGKALGWYSWNEGGKR